MSHTQDISRLSRNGVPGTIEGRRGPAEIDRRPHVRTSRRIIHQSATVQVEDLFLDPRVPAPSGHSTEHQIVLPYYGLFGWQVGRKQALLDANTVLFVGAGEDYSESRPVPGLGHSSAVLTPTPAVLDELCGRSWSAFAEVSRPSSMSVRLLTHRLIRVRGGGGLDRLAADEFALEAMKQTLAGSFRRTSSTAPRIVDLAKQILHAREMQPAGLNEIAKQVGVSPVYLTQTFTRAEGVPLYRYQLRLRLSHALVELPSCEDITGLALDLGFSSHSHFTAAFKAAFGSTPSEYRRASL